MSETGRVCDWPGCRMAYNFYGFGRHLCWKHYSDWILSYKFSVEECPDLPQMVLPLEGDICLGSGGSNDATCIAPIVDDRIV